MANANQGAPLPTSAEALERLRQSQNEPLQWLLGDLLVCRAKRPDWHECGILQQLAAGSTNAEGAWNGLIDRFRRALANPNNARTRAKEILNPAAADFDGKLDDLVAEMVAVVYLSGLDYSRFDFCPLGAVVMPDLRAVKDGKDAFIEVKNLREPPSLTIVAFSRWHANRARDTVATSVIIWQAWTWSGVVSTERSVRQPEAGIISS